MIAPALMILRMARSPRMRSILLMIASKSPGISASELGGSMEVSFDVDASRRRGADRFGR
jgi:hypothetical protein